MSANEVMAVVFLNKRGVIHIDYPQKGRLIMANIIPTYSTSSMRIKRKDNCSWPRRKPCSPRQWKSEYVRRVWQNLLNWAMNCSFNPQFLQIQPPVATPCLQIWVNHWAECNLTPPIRSSLKKLLQPGKVSLPIYQDTNG